MWWSVAKCCSVVTVLVIKVSNIIRRHTDNRKMLLICISLLSHSFIFFRSYFYQYMVVFLFNTVIYVFLLLGLRILIVRLPWLRVFRAFSSVVRQMPGYNSPSRSTARTLPNFCVVLYIVCFVSFYVLFVKQPPGFNQIAVNKYIIPYHIFIFIYALYRE